MNKYDLPTDVAVTAMWEANKNGVWGEAIDTIELRTAQFLHELRNIEAATPAAGIDVERVADAFHDALCDVSHHSSREVYAAAQRETQPCRVKYDRIAARLGASE
jgi:hypothetical protein